MPRSSVRKCCATTTVLDSHQVTSPPAPVKTPTRRSDAGRRRHPHRPTGRTDGTSRNDRMVGGKRVVGEFRNSGPPAADRAESRVGCRAEPDGRSRGSGQHEQDHESASATVQDDSVRAAARSELAAQRPTYRDAGPRSSTPRCGAHNSDRAAIGTRSPPANHPESAVRRGGGGTELVAWRTEDGALKVGPGACPHLGADLATGTVDCGALICPWHGLRLEGGREFGWRPYPSHDDGVLAWVRLDSVGGEEPTEATGVPVRPERSADARCDAARRYLRAA